MQHPPMWTGASDDVYIRAEDRLWGVHSGICFLSLKGLVSAEALLCLLLSELAGYQLISIFAGYL